MIILELKRAVGWRVVSRINRKTHQWNFPILEIKKNGSGCAVLKTVHKDWSEHKVFVIWLNFFQFPWLHPLFLLLLKMSIHWQHILNTHKKHLILYTVSSPNKVSLKQELPLWGRQFNSTVYFTMSVHLQSGLKWGMAFGGRVFLRGGLFVLKNCLFRYVSALK